MALHLKTRSTFFDLIEILAKLDGADIADDEGVESDGAFEVVVEVSEGVIIKLCVKTSTSSKAQVLRVVALTLSPT